MAALVSAAGLGLVRLAAFLQGRNLARADQIAGVLGAMLNVLGLCIAAGSAWIGILQYRSARQDRLAGHEERAREDRRELTAPLNAYLPMPQGLPRESSGLPSDVFRFTGRAAELELLTTAMRTRHDQPKVVTVTAISGTAGVGKSTL